MVTVNKPTTTPQIAPPAKLASSIGFSFTSGKARPKFSILRDFDSIRDNISNIIFFRKGDYPDNPDFGIGIQDYLFENNDEVLRLSLEQEIRRQIRTYEPRASISSLRLYVPTWMEDALVIDLVVAIAGYEFRGIGAQGNFTLYAQESK